MIHSPSHHTWDEASSPTAVALARRFEAAWREVDGSGQRPDLDAFLDSEPRLAPGERLAILRADLGLRWEAGDRVPVESYRRRFPDLGDDTLVALIYEEFCLREEDRDTPDPAEYLARFPEVEEPLRRVFDIHGLLGTGSSTALHLPEFDPVEFPEVDQTIAGFHLVEELGRGSFARVFLAEERQLADRPVALKVARRGSREPQTLARLQHTHIVPVHSYRTDPVSGLHLLCMPYFGRVTLARLLEDPKVRVARTGGEVLGVLRALSPPPSDGGDVSRARWRKDFEAMPYARAIAWWGARLAEALQHAHERGVLHRDIKPSNVLVTPDGMPMLLDFNLAQAEADGRHGLEPEALGGTVAYMAPEHLEALAEGQPGKIDVRADIYSLGVILFEAMGTRPFSPRSKGGGDLAELLRRTAEERRNWAPNLRELHPEVPPALEVVIRRCLEPEATDRYSDAAALAADLQAVADDGPLRHAREPLASRSYRWARRNRRRLTLLIPAILAPSAIVFALIQARVAEAELRRKVEETISAGIAAEELGRYDLAQSQYQAASRMADGPRALAELKARAHELECNAVVAQQVLTDAQRLFKEAERLRFSLLGFDNGASPRSDLLLSVLKPFHVLQHENWTELPELSMLAPDLRARLVREVEELLFFWAVVAASDPAGTRGTLETVEEVCDKALKFTATPGPWQALRERCALRLDGRAGAASRPPRPGREESAWACFQWALILRRLDGERPTAVIGWLDRAVRIDPSLYWAQYYLAYFYDEAGQPDLALAHYNAAIALRPNAPFALFSRAGIYWRRASWARALDDLDRALELSREAPFDRARLEHGLVCLRLGDASRARSDFQAVVQSAGALSALGRSARLDLALLDFESGEVGRAAREYDRLIAEAPRAPDVDSARLGLAHVAMYLGHFLEAERLLTSMLEDDPAQAEALALRSRVRLELGRPREALNDAESAYQLDPMPSRERLRTRALLAAGEADEFKLDRPTYLRQLPGDPARLRRDLRQAERSLGDRPEALKARAVLLAALGDPRAERLATEALEREPESISARLVRARVRRLLGDQDGARADVGEVLTRRPDDPKAQELSGVLALESGELERAIQALERAIRLGAPASADARLAQALSAAGRYKEAIESWTRYLAFDPDDPAGYLGRARACRLVGLPDQALADLETAATDISTSDRPGLLARVCLEYAACLPERPDRAYRVAALARRAAIGLAGRFVRNGP